MAICTFSIAHCGMIAYKLVSLGQRQSSRTICFYLHSVQAKTLQDAAFIGTHPSRSTCKASSSHGFSHLYARHIAFAWCVSYVGIVSLLWRPATGMNESVRVIANIFNLILIVRACTFADVGRRARPQHPIPALRTHVSCTIIATPDMAILSTSRPRRHTQAL